MGVKMSKGKSVSYFAKNISKFSGFSVFFYFAGKFRKIFKSSKK